jgi:hypothetical protein
MKSACQIFGGMTQLNVRTSKESRRCAFAFFEHISLPGWFFDSDCYENKVLKQILNFISDMSCNTHLNACLEVTYICYMLEKTFHWKIMKM